MTSTTRAADTPGPWRVEVRQMFSLTSSGRDGQRKAHAVLLTPEGRVYQIADVHPFRSLEKAQAELQAKADMRNAVMVACND